MLIPQSSSSAGPVRATLSNLLVSHLVGDNVGGGEGRGFVDGAGEGWGTHAPDVGQPHGRVLRGHLVPEVVARQQ